jgi:type II secretory pathway pseudopilin PulG
MDYSEETNTTLIEMLAVVVVILVLASMLMPALLQSRTLALQAVCFSNLKQISTLEMLYAGNNRNWVTPTTPTGSGSPDETPTWMQWLSWDDYLGIGYDGRNLVVSEVNDQRITTTRLVVSYPTPTATSWIYNCPLDKRSTKKLVARSYAINVEIAKTIYGGDYQGRNLNKISNPGEAILFAERIAEANKVTDNDTYGSVIGNDEYAGFSNANSTGTTQVTKCSKNASEWISNHPRKDYLPWLFVDGHLELQDKRYFPSFTVQ